MTTEQEQLNEQRRGDIQMFRSMAVWLVIVVAVVVMILRSL